MENVKVYTDGYEKLTRTGWIERIKENFVNIDDETAAKEFDAAVLASDLYEI